MFRVQDSQNHIERERHCFKETVITIIDIFKTKDFFLSFALYGIIFMCMCVCVCVYVCVCMCVCVCVCLWLWLWLFMFIMQEARRGHQTLCC
jgi:hypothetical protein